MSLASHNLQLPEWIKRARLKPEKKQMLSLKSMHGLQNISFQIINLFNTHRKSDQAISNSV